MYCISWFACILLVSSRINYNKLANNWEIAERTKQQKEELTIAGHKNEKNFLLADLLGEFC